MNILMIILSILGFLATFLPKLYEFIKSAVKDAEDQLKSLTGEERNVKAYEARERIVAAAKAAFPDVPESIIRMGIEAEVYKNKGRHSVQREVELMKKTYWQMLPLE